MRLETSLDLSLLGKIIERDYDFSFYFEGSPFFCKESYVMFFLYTKTRLLNSINVIKETQ